MTETNQIKLPELNPRLLKIAQLVPSCLCLADIGTDHAYIPIWTVLNGSAKKAIASDINRGPVERAEKNVCSFGLVDKIFPRLGGGLSTLAVGEAEVIVISGMGGILISNILNKDKSIAHAAKTLILQPMTAAQELREYLLKNGFSIESEHLVSEDEKIYTIICARFAQAGASLGDYSKKELILGKVFPETSLSLFEKQKATIIKKYEKRLMGLSKSVLAENKLELENVKEILEILKSEEN